MFLRQKVTKKMEEESTSEDEFEETSPKKSYKLSCSSPEVCKDDEFFKSGTDELSAYEQIRLKNIQEREKRIRELGFDEELQKVTPKRKSLNSKTRVKRTKIDYTMKEPLPIREPSRRLRNLSAKTTIAIEPEIKVEQENEPKDERILGSKPMAIENEESEALLSRLAELNNDTTLDPGLNLSTCNVEELQRALSTFQCINEERMLMKRIQSLIIHPTTGKKLIIGGSVNGQLGLWDMDSGHVGNYRPHCALINCISVSNSDLTKLFTTSHDGSVICTDLEISQFSNIYATDFHDRVSHLTWHDQLNAHTLLVTHGNGSVGMLDIREPQTAHKWFPCFDRSARTVQHHPTKENYFVVSSGVGCSSNVYDLRKCSNSVATPVSEMSHKKGLTSAFFSPSGDQVLTTCNDDHVRIFTSPLDSSPVLKRCIPHNNFTGPWLPAFKAMWYPGRDDTFLIGSVLNPRGMQIYGVDGQLINELRDEGMTTITSLIAVHPSLPLIAGGNSSGKVFVFSK